MRHILYISLIYSTTCFGQTYEKFIDYSTKELKSNQSRFSNYYQDFLTLLTKRDTSYLKSKLTKSNADKIYIIEGYNFKFKQYSIFEEYNNSIGTRKNSEFYLDKELQKIKESYFLHDIVSIKKDSFSIDTIFPRKYRFGAGCILADTTIENIKKLELKAKNDGIIIEKYCRIETLIDKTTNKIFIRYCFPVSGQREFENLGIGMLTDYPSGLDFWLFTSPYFVDK